MKKNIHPTYYFDAKVTCNCGYTFLTGSTKQFINVEVCYKCHPFYTGEHRFLDTKGRVDSFIKKQEAAKKYQALSDFSQKKHKKEKKEERRPKTLRELLTEI